MKRTPVNPWPWTVQFGFNQALLVEGHGRQLVCSGQTSVDTEGNTQHSGDMAAQLDLAVHNLEAVLAGAGMTLANVVRLNIYTTDVDSFFKHFGALSDRLVDAGGVASTLLGVERLAFPGLLVELEATAVD